MYQKRLFIAGMSELLLFRTMCTGEKMDSISHWLLRSLRSRYRYLAIVSLQHAMDTCPHLRYSLRRSHTQSSMRSPSIACLTET